MTLIEWRKANKLTQPKAAAILGLTQSTISRLEGGKQWPDRETVRQIVEGTKGQVTPNDLLIPNSLRSPPLTAGDDPICAALEAGIAATDALIGAMAVERSMAESGMAAKAGDDLVSPALRAGIAKMDAAIAAVDAAPVSVHGAPVPEEAP